MCRDGTRAAAIGDVWGVEEGTRFSHERARASSARQRREATKRAHVGRRAKRMDAPQLQSGLCCAGGAAHASLRRVRPTLHRTSPGGHGLAVGTAWLGSERCRARREHFTVQSVQPRVARRAPSMPRASNEPLVRVLARAEAAARWALTCAPVGRRRRA